MKKKFLIAVLPLLLATGCKTNNPPNQSASDHPVVEGFIKNKTKISIWTIIGQNNRTVFERVIEEFKKLEPNVEIENTYKASDYNGLKDSVIEGFAANNYPDLVQCYPDHVAEYLNYNKAVRLDDYMNSTQYGWSEEDKKDYIANFVTEGQSYTTTGTYSLPFSKSTEAMFYNKLLIGLDLHGVDATINEGHPLNETYLNNLTWEELFGKLCPAIIKYNDNLPTNKKILNFDKTENTSAVFAYDSDDNLFITLAAQYGVPFTSVKNGAGVFDFVDNEASSTALKAMMKQWNEFANKGYIMSKGSANNKYTNEFFTQNKSLFSVGSTGGVKYQYTKNFETCVGKIPHAEGKKAMVINQGPSITVLDHDAEDRKLASWLFYRYLTNVENAAAWSVDTGYSPIRKSTYQQRVYLKSVDVEGKDYSDTVLMANSKKYVETVTDDYFVSPAFLGSSAARQAGKAIMTKTLTRGKALTDVDLDKLFEEAKTACHKAQ